MHTVVGQFQNKRQLCYGISRSFQLVVARAPSQNFPPAWSSSLRSLQSSAIKYTSSPSSSPSSGEQQQLPVTSIRDVDDRPMTASERIKVFPTAVKDLYKDYGLYGIINETAACGTKNAWKGRIPRKQREQQRHFLESMGVVGPLILVWIPPIIGYLPMVLSIVAPRQVLSRHFHNVFEVLDYMYIADRHRRQYWPTLQERVGNSISNKDSSSNAIVRLFQQKEERLDTVEPMVADAETVQLLHRTMNAVPLLDRRDTVLSLALSVGVYSSLPPVLGRMFAVMSPTSLMRRQLLYWADGVAIDDQLLLEERDTLAQLSRVELTEACYRRALPTEKVDDDALRRSLEHHLEMVSHLPTNVEHKGLWSLVYNIIRQSRPKSGQLE